MLWPNYPFRDFERMRREMNQLFRRFSGYSEEYQFPLVNVYDSVDDLTVLAEIPGVPKDAIDINYKDGILKITGKRDLSKYGKSELLRQEQPDGSFEKLITIQARIKGDQISARYQDGMLMIMLPKSEEAKPQQITIQS